MIIVFNDLSSLNIFTPKTVRPIVKVTSEREEQDANELDPKNNNNNNVSFG